MVDALKTLVWPSGSWKMLKKIIRAWYAAEECGREVTQKAIAEIAKMQASRLSMNKPFLQSIGIIEPEGIALTENGKRLGLGLQNENERVIQQALQTIVRDNPLLGPLWGIIRGRGPINMEDFEAEVLLLTKQGKGSDYFGTGVSVLEDILMDSGLVGMSDDGLRPTTGELKIEPKDSLNAGHKTDPNKVPGLRTIPIPVSASTVWYIQVADSFEEVEIDRFIEMQKLIFGRK